MRASDASSDTARTKGAVGLIGKIRDALRPARPWLGHAIGFRVEPATDPVFSRRIVLNRPAAGRWLVLAYASDTSDRPMLRLERGGMQAQEFPLPGVTEGRAFWLGLMPRDLTGIGLSAVSGSGFRLERATLRGHGSLLLECLLKRPLRFPPALYEFVRRDERRFRDILRGACAVVPMSRHEAFAEARADQSDCAPAPLAVRLVLPAGRDVSGVADTIAGLHGQSHRSWSLVVLWDTEVPAGDGDPRVTHRLWREADSWGGLIGEGAGFGLLAPGDRLMPDALGRLVAALVEPGTSPAGLAYADHISDRGPFLKPGWSPDLALATGYHASPALLSPVLAANLAGMRLGPRADAATAFEIAATMATSGAVHVPRVLCRTGAASSDIDQRSRLLSETLQSADMPATARFRDGVLDLQWPMPDPAPLVSIVIPSKDRLDLIARVSCGVLAETAYPALEMIIVDNGSTDASVLAHYEALKRDPRVTIQPFPAPFNFSAMVNTGVAVSSGSVVVLLNNDVAVLEPDWLDAMVRQALRPEVGAVGAKLLYGNGTLQHAGVVVGLGGRAGHILRRRPANTPGRLERLRVAHEVSAVTAACLAVTREKYEAVGGFDAEAFPVDFNDVDFCLRLGAAGWKTIWTPRATLAHLESVSRGPSVGEKRARFEREADLFVARWRETIRRDPFYHPALSLTTFGEELE